jgi:hypothetical protein
MSKPLRVRIEFETPGDPIAGTLFVDGAQQSFTGWLGLMSGLQRAVDNQREPHEEPASAQRPCQ